MRAAISAVRTIDGGPLRPARVSSLADRAILPYTALHLSWNDATAGLVTLQRQPAGRSDGGPSKRSSLLSAGPRAVALDGTIDNRAELADRLGVVTEPGGGDSSLHLILAAYERWGVLFPQHLLGEFSIVLWDGPADRLVAARDPFGVRPLFFRSATHELWLGSQLRQLLCADLQSFDEIDQEYLADFLALRDPFGDGTAFSSIKRLRAGHVLVGSQNGVQVLPYWDLERRTDLGDGDHLAEFQGLFREAVSRYLDTPGRVWAELSGGLDSSSIVSMAAGELREQGDPGDFEAVTLTWPETPQSDEREWAERVLAQTGVKGNFLNGEEKFFTGATEEARYWNDPHFALLCHPLFRDEAELLARAGVDVLLSGARAESVVLQENQAPYFLADLVKRLQLKAFLRQVSKWQRASEAPYLSVVQAYAWRPLVTPRQVQRKWNRNVHVSPWITRHFRRRLGLVRRAKTSQVPRRFTNPSTQIHYRMLRRTEQSAELGSLGWSVEVRFPFLYRPLVEHAFSLPWELKIAPTRDKRLLREGMVGILPDSIRDRRGWKSPTYAAFRTLTRSGRVLDALSERSHLVNLGVFDSELWRTALEKARHGYCDHFVALTSSMALEYWLRSFFGEPERT